MWLLWCLRSSHKGCTLPLVSKPYLNFVHILYLRGTFKKKLAGGLGTETTTCMSEVLTLAVVPLLHKTVNGCLVNFPGLRCETVPHVLLDVVVRGESFASHSLFLGDQKWRNRRERVLDCMEGDREPPTWISARLPWFCWPYEALHCRGAEWPTGVGITLCYWVLRGIYCIRNTDGAGG